MWNIYQSSVLVNSYCLDQVSSSLMYACGGSNVQCGCSVAILLALASANLLPLVSTKSRFVSPQRIIASFSGSQNAARRAEISSLFFIFSVGWQPPLLVQGTMGGKGMWSMVQMLTVPGLRLSVLLFVLMFLEAKIAPRSHL